MELKDIKAINQRIYELDDKISRESKQKLIIKKMLLRTYVVVRVYSVCFPIRKC